MNNWITQEMEAWIVMLRYRPAQTLLVVLVVEDPPCCPSRNVPLAPASYRHFQETDISTQIDNSSKWTRSNMLVAISFSRHIFSVIVSSGDLCSSRHLSYAVLSLRYWRFVVQTDHITFCAVGRGQNNHRNPIDPWTC